MSNLLCLLLVLSFSLRLEARAENTKMKDMIKYLASDALEGRKPGKPGNEMAVTYLVDQFQGIGLEGFANSYKQDFTIFTQMSKAGKNKFFFGENDQSFQPISYSLSGEVENAPVAFVGYGISIPKGDTKLQYDDYANIDVKNKIVIVLTGDPGIGNTDSKFRDPDYISYRSLFYKLKNAIARGAKGILLINDPLSLPNYPQEERLFFNSSEGGGSRFSILSGKVTNRFINTKLPSGKSTLSLQKKISKTQKPQSFLLKGKASLSVQLKKKTGRVANVVGFLRGSDPVLSREVIVIGAHMDHLGFGGDSSMEPGHERKIHNGADDNASGTAVVTQIARELKVLRPRRSYAFVLFNAEEMGLLGSTYFVEMWARHTEEYGKMVAMLNFDMVGRFNKDVSVMGVNSSLLWRTLLTPISPRLSTVLKNDAIGSSDHAAFLSAKIPSLFFTTGAHEDYHRSSDKEEKINYQGVNSIKDYSLELIKGLDKAKKISFNPDYTSESDAGGTRGYGAHLGCVPEFGQSDDIKGVVCVRAMENSPAIKAGILPGDILVQIGEIDIKGIYDLAFALKHYRAGDKIELAWLRGETLMKQMITLARSTRH